MRRRISDLGPASTRERLDATPADKARRYHHHQPHQPYLGLEHMLVSASDAQQPARVEFGHALHQAPEKCPLRASPSPPSSSTHPTHTILRFRQALFGETGPSPVSSAIVALFQHAVNHMNSGIRSQLLHEF